MNYRIITVAALLVALPAVAQKKKTVVNDSNTPLHLLQPAYQGTEICRPSKLRRT